MWDAWRKFVTRPQKFSEIDIFRLQKYLSAPIGNENLRLEKKKDVVDGTIYLGY